MKWTVKLEIEGVDGKVGEQTLMEDRARRRIESGAAGPDPCRGKTAACRPPTANGSGSSGSVRERIPELQ